MTGPDDGLALAEVSHDFGATRAVDDVSLSVARGEIVALLGPSGCGKSTLLRVAAGLETLQRGNVAIGGETVAAPGRSLPPEARSVGMMFQDFALFPHLTVARNVAFGLAGSPPAARRRTVARLLDRVGLAGRAGDYPHALSGGEQQRVALARALAPEPRAMLLDEPFSGLDRLLRRSLRESAIAVLREARTPVLMVTHDPEEAMLVADRVAVMREGRILQIAPPDVLYRRPADPFCATLPGEAQRFDGTVRGGRAVTPVGAFPAPGLVEGAAAQVLVRPEGVRLDAAAGPAATVRAVRSIGRSGIATLTLDSGAELRAHAPWWALPETGARVRISVAGAMAFVFPAQDR